MRMLKHVMLVPSMLVVVLFCVNMGEGGAKKYSASTNEPTFAPLEEGAGNYSGSVFDEKTETKLSHLSFYGSTSVGGLRQEDNDSVSSFDLSRIHTLEVVEPNFQSKRFNNTFVRVNVTLRSKKDPNKTKKLIREVLVPQRVTICGLEEETGMQKAWFLEKISKIVVTMSASQIEAMMPEEKRHGFRKRRSMRSEDKENMENEQSAQVKKKH